MKASTLYPKILKALLAAAFWAVVWYLVAFFIDKEIFLPYPHTVVRRLFELSTSADFWKTVWASLIRIIAGFIAGALLGFWLALVTKYVPFIKTFITPALRTVRATPVVSFILLAYLWLNNDTIPIFIALLMVVPIIWENISAGLRSLVPNLSEKAKAYRLPRNKSLTKLILPQLAPYFYSGGLTSLGLAWKSGIAAEVISYPRVAIGKAMNDAKVVLDTADVLVWTVVVVALSLIFEGIFKLLFKKGGRKI